MALINHIKPEMDDPNEIQILTGGVRQRGEIVEEVSDPFSIDVEDIRKMHGLSANSKKRISREITKVNRTNSNGAGTKIISQEQLTGYTVFDVVQPPYNLDHLAKLYDISSPHHAAVRAKVSNIVGLGFELIESPKVKIRFNDLETAEEKQKLAKKVSKVRLTLMEWLDNRNDDDDFMETLIKVWTDYEVTGNGYLEIGRDINGVIGYIGHVPSTMLRVRKERDGFVQAISNKVVFFRNFGQKNVDPLSGDPRPNEIIHFKRYSPGNSYYGVPNIVAAQQAVAGNEFAARFNLDYFENKAVPRYVIVVKGAALSPKSQQSLIEFFDTGLKGKHHRTIYVPLPADQTDNKTSFEMKPVEAGTQDASFVNYNKINLQSILMAHGVPVTKVSVSDGAGLAAARDADKTFKEQECRPAQRLGEKKINQIIKEVTDILVFKFNELSLTDEDTQSKIDERDVRNNILLPNEIRTRRGLPGLKNGDKTAAENQALTAQQQADRKATATQSRTRDAARSAAATDSAGQGRNTKGDGKAAP